MASSALGAYSSSTGTTCWRSHTAATRRPIIRAASRTSTSPSSRSRSVPAIWPAVCSHAGSAMTIELPPCRQLALDLLPPLLAPLGALVSMTTAQHDGRDLAGAGQHAGGAYRRSHAEGARRLGGLAYGGSSGLEPIQHRC